MSIMKTLIALSLLLLLQLARANPNPLFSCSQMPFPEACRSHVSPSAFAGPGFRHANLLSTLQQVQKAYAAALAVSTKSFDPRSIAAWSDCMELFLDINSRLVQSMDSSANDDSQSWLSSALADMETCRNGFVDFGYGDRMSSSPFFSFNVSKLLCNSLAINKGMYTPPPPSRRLLSGFPEWVSPGDRKLLQMSTPKANLVVAGDGSGNYRTIGEAIAAAAKTRGSSTSTRFVIYVKTGVYNENVEVTSSMKNLMILGDGIDKTVVTGSRNIRDGSTIFSSATFATVGDRFIARDMTFENTAGPQKFQAVALRSGADFSVFYRCSFKGYQDTLYPQSLRQFYRECNIYGTVDFIFGDAAVVLQNCNIYCRQPLPGQQNTITAQGRTDPNENTGTSIHNSLITAASGLSGVKSYLGRPWKQYSRTVILKTNIGSLIDPAGWLEWSGNFALDTLYYGEYANTGPGASLSGRVKWKGYQGEISAANAGKFTVSSLISGGSWLPGTGVPFTAGL